MTDLDLDWLDARDGGVFWQMQSTTRVTGFRFREPRTYEVESSEQHSRHLHRFFYETEVVSLKVGNEEQLRISPTKLDSLFTAVELRFPIMEPGVILWLMLRNCPKDVIWQLRPIGLSL